METGINIEVTGLISVFSDPRHVVAYADGEVRQSVKACFTAYQSGRLTAANKATDVA